MSRLPAEWEEQSALLMTWPCSKSHWNEYLPQVEQVYCEIIRNVTDHEKVILSIHDDASLDRVTAILGDSDITQNNLEFCIVPSNDCWTRDHGPVTSIINDHPVLLDFEFNGWNNKFDAGLDNRITHELNVQGAFNDIDIRNINLVLEGGSIETNGNGWLFTTTSCLLDNNRNPGYDRQNYESVFFEYFGCNNVVWLEHGMLAGDDTDGHIDTLLRSCNENMIVYQDCNDPANIDYASLKKMEEQLARVNSECAHKFTLVPVPAPDKFFSEDNKPLPASYVNFIITNRKILVPAYGDKNDARAESILAECFPEREVTAINALPLIQQSGSLHCITMQLPAGVCK